MEQKTTPTRRWVKPVLLTLLAIVLILVFYIAVVMGQPQTDAVSSARNMPAVQPLPEPLAAPVTVSDADGLRALAEVFPVPLMYAGGRTLTFLSGSCEDVPFEDGVARIVTLTYRTEDFDTLTLQSIYPARALSLLGRDGRSFTGVTVDNMAGMKYVGMQDAATLRMHAQGEALYVFTVPTAEYRVIDQWTNTLQLYRPDAE